MRLLDHTWPTPEENLAGDEALLDAAESGAGGECLRFWSPTSPFVVVGYANRFATEVNLDACAADGVPVLRRCSGGGTVLQMAACLNYALVLRADPDTPLAGITGANQFIMERHRAAIEAVAGRPIHVRGHTDLTLGELKFSGNSQRRRRRFLLFHGVFLLACDLPRIERLLAMPSRQPDYRQDRRHLDFVSNLGLECWVVKAALQRAWDATEASGEVPPRIPTAMLDRYRSREWNERF